MVPMRLSSSTIRSIATKRGSPPRISATSARVFPVRGLSASLLNPTSRMLSADPEPSHMFSQASDSSSISAAIRCRVGSSCRRSSEAAKPPSCTHGGMITLSPVPLAG